MYILEALAQQITSENVRPFAFAMHQKHAFGLFDIIAGLDEFAKFLLIRMAAVARELDDIGLDFKFFAEDFHCGVAVQDACPQGPFSAKSGCENRIPFVADAICKRRSSSSKHSGCIWKTLVALTANGLST